MLYIMILFILKILNPIKLLHPYNFQFEIEKG